MSINSIRKSVSLFWDGSVTEDLLIEIKDRVEKYQDNLIKEVIKDFQAYNNIRRFHHLPTLKRLSRQKIYKQIDYIEDGENGEKPIETHSSKADEVFL